MRLTIIIPTLAFGVLTACNPLDPPVQFDTPLPITVDVTEGQVSTPDCDIELGGTIDVESNTCNYPPVPAEETPPTYPEHCDVELGGTYDVESNTCTYLG